MKRHLNLTIEVRDCHGRIKYLEGQVRKLKSTPKTDRRILYQSMAALAEKKKELAFQAILLDPLTSSLLTIDETRRMVDEMFEAEARYLPGFQ